MDIPLQTNAKESLIYKALFSKYQVIVTLTDSDIEKLDDLKGKEVGIQAQSSAVDAWNALSN